MSLLIKNATLLSGKQSDILLEGNKIAKMGRSIASSAGEKIDASGKIALPGFINTHTHAAMSLMRGSAEDMQLADWLATVRKEEQKLTPKHIRAGSALACLEMIKGGTTCFSDMYFHMDEVAAAVEESGMRAVLGYGMVDLGGEKKRASELSIAENFIKEWHGKAEGRITASSAPHSLYL
ncbi:5'-deoxyadenosine deaminase [uncultured archaeon]|nr:5'-deoxyadenosine deaminase [uncultured archaeon]